MDDLTAAEFERLLDEEASALAPDVWAVYDRHAVPPVRMAYTWDWGAGPVSKPIWVVARAGEVVVGYEEVEEYGTGVVRREGTVDDWGTFGSRLAWALVHLPGRELDPHLSGRGPR